MKLLPSHYGLHSLAVILLLLIYSCNNYTEADNYNAGAPPETMHPDSSLQKVNRIFNNPYRSINNFDIKFGDNLIDSLHNAFANDKLSAFNYERNICLGDNCTSMKEISNNTTHSVLYIFKSDAGEYGFSNDQYFLRNDSIKYVRNFSVDVEIPLMDNDDIQWIVQEKLYNFDPKAPFVRSRKVITKNLDHFDYTLKQAPSTIQDLDVTIKVDEKMEELKKLLNMMNMDK